MAFYWTRVVRNGYRNKGAFSLLRPLQKRHFSGSPTNRFPWKVLGGFLLTGAGFTLYLHHEKTKLLQQRKQQDCLDQQHQSTHSKPAVGGPFTLTNAATNTPFSDTDLHGHFSLVYFGFTHCPDICPEELEKMTHVMNAVEKNLCPSLLPVFITCDPKRDTVPVVKEYLEDFHPAIIGLTGEPETIVEVAKSYRVYVKIPDTADEDYIVDHSSYFYLMGPHGQFIECYSRESALEDIISSIRMHADVYSKD
ncbi:SCO1/SenC-domain-containing protein [Spinellus fusiger]|nr:SCO1/SenC-domain-containing protein [Spinellus fusiger]